MNIKDVTPEALERLAVLAFPANVDAPLYRVTDRQTVPDEAFRGFMFEANPSQVAVRDEDGIPAVAEYTLAVSCATDDAKEWELWCEVVAGLSATYAPKVADGFIAKLEEPFNSLRLFSMTISGQESTVTEARRFTVTQTFTFSLAPVFIDVLED